jgi:hypothetical protein
MGRREPGDPLTRSQAKRQYHFFPVFSGFPQCDPRKDPLVVAEALDVVPKRVFPAEPVVESLADLGDALELLAYFQSRKENAANACAAKVRLAKAEESQRLIVKIEGRDRRSCDSLCRRE